MLQNAINRYNYELILDLEYLQIVSHHFSLHINITTYFRIVITITYYDLNIYCERLLIIIMKNIILYNLPILYQLFTLGV